MADEDLVTKIRRLKIITAILAVLVIVLSLYTTYATITLKELEKLAFSKRSEIARVYFFYSNSCPACEEVLPYVQNVSKYIDIVPCCVDENMSSECKEIKDMFDVKYIPTAVVLFENGRYIVLIGSSEVRCLGKIAGIE